VAITSRGEAGRPVDDLFPNLRGHFDLCFSDPAAGELDQCDVVFFATPHGVAQSTVPDLLEKGIKVIDLSADFSDTRYCCMGKMVQPAPCLP
jgi:N-acetyl-gamma-glutamyl-phosphate reductase